MFIDSHCHFDFSEFDRQREHVWVRCQNKEIKKLIIPGIHPLQWSDARRIAERLPGVYYTVGIHPRWVDAFYQQGGCLSQPLVNDFNVHFSHPKCVGVGEIGLDLSIETKLDRQSEVFEFQLRIAQDKQQAVIIHSLRTHSVVQQTVRAFELERGGVIHAFSGSKEIAQAFWHQGFYLGVGGVVTYARAKKTRAALQTMPLEALLLETDAPDMPLCGRQGEPNSPEYITDIAENLAALRNVPVQRIASQTSANAARLFCGLL